MSIEQRVAEHYTLGTLEQAILDGAARAGKDPNHLSADDLAPADEFHIGGRQATADLAAQLDLKAGMHLLDIGSGIGGPARYFAQHHRCHVTGIDLTKEYVRIAAALTRRVGLDGQAEFVQSSALAMPFGAGRFDGAYLFHVGMNIDDKARLFAEVRRVLRPEGFFAIYDVMRTSDGELAFPVPWAKTPETSFVADAATYRRLLREASFAVQKERDRHAFAIDFFKKMGARIAESGLPPLGAHLAIGADFPQMRANILANLERGLIAPTEMISRAA